MAKQGLTLEQKQTQRLALEQQRLLGLVLEKNDAEMAEFIDNKVNEIQALEKKNDDDDEFEGDKDNRNDGNRGDDGTTPTGEVNSDGDDDTAAWYRYFANNRSPDDEYYAPIAVTEPTSWGEWNSTKPGRSSQMPSWAISRMMVTCAAR